MIENVDEQDENLPIRTIAQTQHFKSYSRFQMEQKDLPISLSFTATHLLL